MKRFLTDLHDRMQREPLRWFYFPTAALTIIGLADLVSVLPLKAGHEFLLLLGPLGAASSILLLIKARWYQPPP
jgi:hypothetical protein